MLVVNPDATVLPLTHELSPSLALGSLTSARLSELAPRWLASGKATALASACERTWAQLTSGLIPPAVYWFDEVAARTQPARLPLATASRADVRPMLDSAG